MNEFILTLCAAEESKNVENCKCFEIFVNIATNNIVREQCTQ